MKKQGTPDRKVAEGQWYNSNSGAHRVDAKGVNPSAVARLGNMQGNHATDTGDFTYRPNPWRTEGFMAPAGKPKKINPCGSQGKY